MRYLARSFVGPKAWPLLGNAYLFLGVKPEDLVQIMANIFKDYGKTVKLWLGPVLAIFMQDANDLEYILGTNNLLIKSQDYDFLNDWLCEGLLISKPPKWFKRRRILTPAFHFTILEQFIELFEHNTRIFVKNLHEAAEKSNGLIQMDHWVHLLTLDIICETAMGVSCNAQTNADTEYVRAVKTISSILFKRMFDILYRFKLIYKFTKLAQEEKKALAVLHGFSENVILERREELLKTKENSAQPQSDDVGLKRKMTFLDILLQSEIDGKPLSNLDIREEVDTFMFEGHDTTSSAINFCFYNLAMNPKYQQKCFEEIIKVFGKDKTKPVSYKGLNNLHYVELCIKETLRMYPSVPLIGRKVTEDCHINGKILPAGTNISISIFHLGRQEDLFPEPNTFKPERFEMIYTTDKRSAYAYIPFSAGPRNCIGQKFAMLEIKTVLANVLRHYELEYAGKKDENLLLIADLTLSPRDPLMFKIKPRVY
ncbi:cytochrome P450 4d1-like [Calliphora vicina]|uniref:cytochrome P450 4d1-like n=1 Tax=Calliphora vicina TaxID=7373 RepID=UPI00325B266C